jgi:hypothetical protein
VDDAIEETIEPSQPDPSGSNGTLYISCPDDMTEEEMLAAHDLFLKRLINPRGLIAEISTDTFSKQGHLCRNRPKEHGVIQRSLSQVFSC